MTIPRIMGNNNAELIYRSGPSQNTIVPTNISHIEGLINLKTVLYLIPIILNAL